jgi:orotidine-5'-phosphate decarboxylase
MMQAAVSGMTEGAAAVGAPTPCVLGVTVLTSDIDAPPDALTSRSRLAAVAGCGGLVCAASDLAVTRAAAPGLLTVVPGIRPAGTTTDDQSRASTPGDAIAAGADILVIGRAVTSAEDPEAMAAAVVDEVASSMASARG